MEVEKFYSPGSPYLSSIYFGLLELVNEKKIKCYLTREENLYKPCPSSRNKNFISTRKFCF